jgi:DNA-binding protein HU-beta
MPESPPTIGRGEVVKQLAARTNTTQQQAAMFLDEFTKLITENLRDGTTIALTGFGTWRPTTRAATTGVNPQTRERIQIPARRSAAFQLGTKLKHALSDTT